MPAQDSPASTDDRRAIPDHAGEEYIAVLRRLHQALAPRTYFEIGTQAGRSLAVANCASLAVDPAFALAQNVLPGKRHCHFYQMTSDAFFAAHNPATILGRSIDIAFLDGMHLAEFLLRDFMNTERHMAPGGLILLHDCAPTELYMARRGFHDPAGREHARHPDWWAGDVWKTVHMLLRYRPDLIIHTYDASPTGLVLVTNLDPSNTALYHRHDAITQEMASLRLEDIGLGNWVRSLALRPTTSISKQEQIDALRIGPFSEP
jgi:hypothetical protein